MDKVEFLIKVKEFEGFRSKAYKCPSGVLTIGYGHTHGVIAGMSITESFATRLLLDDLDVVKSQLNTIHLYFSCMPFGFQYAIIDFVFNVGISKYRRSILCKIVESVSHSDIFDDSCRQRISVELQKWCFAKGKKLRGLEKRRNWECELLYID